MNRRVGGLRDHDLVHELQEIHPHLCLGCFYQNMARRHVQGGKKIGYAAALVGAGLAPHDAFARIGEPARAFERLDGFSSTLRTTALAGGLTYRPTTSAALCANSGSLLTHQKRLRARWMPLARSARATACCGTSSAHVSAARATQSRPVPCARALRA